MVIKILFTKPFLKQYNNLTGNMKEKVKEKIDIFKIDPKNPTLKTHKLNGKLTSFYSFSVDYSYRIVFDINKDGDFVFLKVGNHSIYR